MEWQLAEKGLLNRFYGNIHAQHTILGDIL
jgi:hypothetical protein